MTIRFVYLHLVLSPFGLVILIELFPSLGNALQATDTKSVKIAFNTFVHLLQRSRTGCSSSKTLDPFSIRSYFRVIKLWKLAHSIARTVNVSTHKFNQTFHPTLARVRNHKHLSVFLVRLSSFTTPIGGKTNTHAVHQTVHSPLSRQHNIFSSVCSSAILRQNTIF